MFHIGINHDGDAVVGCEKNPNYSAKEYAYLLWLLGKKNFQTALFKVISQKLSHEGLEQVCKEFLALEQSDLAPAIPPTGEPQ
jgi:hypothetical protein